MGYVMFGWPHTCENEGEKPFYVRRAEIYLDHGCLLYKYRVIIPGKLQERVLNEIHSGHLGIVKMKSIARNFIYWSSIDKDIETLCQNCRACINVRDAPPKSSVHPWEFPATAWQRLHADFAQYNGKYYIVVIDAHSKWIEAEAIRSISANDTTSFFRKLFARFGLPLQLVTDNGPPFQSNDFKEFCMKNNIRHSLTSPYRPQGNGAAENSVKSVKKALKRAYYEGQELETGLNRFLFQYRNCEHATTGVAPAVALLGRRLRSRLDAMRPNTNDIVLKAQDKQIVAAGGTSRYFEVGDKVLTRNYAVRSDKWTEGNIVEKIGPVSYRINLDGGSNCRRHADQILPLRHNRFSQCRRHSIIDTDPPNEPSERPQHSDMPRAEHFMTPESSPVRSPCSAVSVNSEKSACDALPSPESPSPVPSPLSNDRATRAYNREMRKKLG